MMPANIPNQTRVIKLMSLPRIEPGTVILVEPENGFVHLFSCPFCGAVQMSGRVQVNEQKRVCTVGDKMLKCYLCENVFLIDENRFSAKGLPAEEPKPKLVIYGEQPKQEQMQLEPEAPDYSEQKSWWDK